MDPDAIPAVVTEGWLAYGDPRAIADVEEVSADVSTNRVYRLILADGSHVVAKASSYGSFVHFRQDHHRIARWIELLGPTRFAGVLAPVLGRGDEPYIHRDGPAWSAFYGEVERGELLPPILDEDDIAPLGGELAAFHRTCLESCSDLRPTWKTLGSDLVQLRDLLEWPGWSEPRGIGRVHAEFLREHCDAFLTNADALGYHGWPKIPVLVDWNLGNFSVGRHSEGLRLASRWDYDWFRIEPRMLDFYFLARIVSSIGDRTDFSYTTHAFSESRFVTFLRGYHEVHPLTAEELLFLKEVYRFFLLNYVIREGEHFFRADLCQRLRRETLDHYLPALLDLDLTPLLDAVL